MKTKIYHDSDWLKAKYWDEGLSTTQIADIGGCSAEQIRYWMIKHSISRRSYSEACPLIWKTDAALRQRHSNLLKDAWKRGCFEGRFTEEVLVKIRQKHSEAHARGAYDEAHKIQGDLLKAAWADGKFEGIVYPDRHGPNNPNWNGGSSFEPYPLTFNDGFKQLIRARDNCTCAICLLPGKDVHHINYVKEDTVPENCIILCRSCHGATLGNRDYWQQELSSLIHTRGIGA